ncbi:MAG: response regulator transcription factor [Anaerolineaceae bacterium]
MMQPETNLRPLTTSTGMDLDQIYEQPDRKRVLIVDDDTDMVFLLKQILRTAGFDVVGATSGAEAVKKCTDLPPNIILLDLMMPEIDGWKTYEYLREITGAPVIIISAISAKDEVVKGLQLGVEDYVTKPFYNAEVVARVQTVLRRATPPQPVTHLVFPEIQLVIDLDAQEVKLRDIPVHLTNREFAILALLARRSSENVNYETIAREIWGQDNPDVRKRIKYLIYLLRRKLETDPGKPQLILNNEGFGYKLNTLK